MISIAIRADGAPAIGAGHLARCLALADAVAARGGTAHFVCRAHPGHFGDLITSRGHQLTLLPCLTAGWRGDSSAGDAAATAAALDGHTPDWLVVDHYSVDLAWCAQMRRNVGRLMVIDDEINRPLDADVVLNQNADDVEQAYRDQQLTPATCQILAGPRYALLRPEFAAHRRTASRRFGAVGRVCVSLGGSDPDCLSAVVLQAMASAPLPDDAGIDVAFGSDGPWVGAAHAAARQLPWPVAVHVGVADMAAWYLRADLAIGAAGSSSWERCCVGIASIAIVIADNQRLPARCLTAQGAAVVVSREAIVDRLPVVMADLIRDPLARQTMSERAMRLVDGGGVDRVLTHLCEAVGERTNL